MPSYLLLESGDHILLEDASGAIILEGAPVDNLAWLRPHPPLHVAHRHTWIQVMVVIYFVLSAASVF